MEKKIVKKEDRSKKNQANWLIILGVLLFGVYLVMKNAVGLDFTPEIDKDAGYGILFAVGLLSSLHCTAMCGGINLSLCMSYHSGKPDGSRFSKLLPSFMYNAGRVASYTLIGGIAGAAGSVFRMSNAGSTFISVLAGIFMIIMGLNMLHIFPWLRKLNPHMPMAFAGIIHSGKKGKGPFVVGLLNGLMPCGPLQAVQLYALGTGSFLAGAFSMFMFSIGTVPLLFAFGAFGSLMSSRLTQKMVKAGAVLVILLGLGMINRGIAFTGMTFGSSAAVAGSGFGNTSTVRGDVQEIMTELEPGSYPLITVQAGIPVRWTIHAEEENLNTCNNEIIIPQYDIRKKLVPGENVITFTPEETGKFGYSCWMGMIRSSISVTDNVQNTENQGAAESPTDTDEAGLPAGCCGL